MGAATGSHILLVGFTVMSWFTGQDLHLVSGKFPCLPDNEFRYLRIVIVTTAVHRGFSRQLLLANNQLLLPSGTGQASAPIDRLATLRKPVFLVNSRLGLFSATSSSEAFLLPKLRNYFAEFLRES